VGIRLGDVPFLYSCRAKDRALFCPTNQAAIKTLLLAFSLLIDIFIDIGPNPFSWVSGKLFAAYTIC